MTKRAENHRQHSERVAALMASTLVVSALSCGGLTGGVLCLLMLDTHISSEATPVETIYLSSGAVLCGFLAAAMARGLRHHRSRRPWYVAITLGMGIAIGVFAGEIVLRAGIPAWPARALHGVEPSQWAAATRPGRPAAIARLDLNSWGERDRERTLSPRPRLPRIAFIGDSFLEEGAGPPVSLVTEAKIGTSRAEVINLGVSATGPDEYFDRMREIAVPLGVTHCYLFLFSGNDFVSPARTLSSYGGIASVEPRRSLLSSLWLAGWNHVLTNKARPVMQAWMLGAQLAREEESRSYMLTRATDDQMRSMLLGASGTSGAEYERLSTVINHDRMLPVFEMLRKPDAEKFRSYYLSDALSAAARKNWQWPANSEKIAWEWTECAVRLCHNRRIGLTVVMIPEAFQIDDRMRDQWLPLADMRHVTTPCREAAARYVALARAANLDVIDLHEELAGVRGTYLNLDGHWSFSGVEKVSDRLAKHWLARETPTGL